MDVAAFFSDVYAPSEWYSSKCQNLPQINAVWNFQHVERQTVKEMNH